MHFSLSICQLVLATTFLGTYISPIAAYGDEPSTFQKLKARKTDGIQDGIMPRDMASGSGAALPTGTIGNAIPTGKVLQGYTYDNGTKNGTDTGPMVKVSNSTSS